MTTCHVCQIEIEPSRHGRPRKYCSEKCRSRARRMRPASPLDFHQAIGEIGKKPAFVKGQAARIWKQYVPQLDLTFLDGEMFGALCCLMAEFQESPTTFPTPRLSQLRGLAKSFGLTPGAARRGVKAEPPRKPDPAERFFK